MRRIIWILPVFVLYLSLTGSLEVGNLLAGLIVSILLMWLIHPQHTRLSLISLMVRLGYFLRYVGLLWVDILRSGINVARIVLSPAMPINPGIIAIPTNCQSEVAQALSAHSLAITPGELLVEVGEDGLMYTHCLDATHGPEYILAAQQRRRDLLQKIVA